MCWNGDYLIIGVEDQYVVNCCNNTTQISSVAIHVVMVDMHTFYPWPFNMWLHRYDAHAASLSFYMSQIDY